MKREMHFIQIDSLVDYWRRYWIGRVSDLSEAKYLDDIAKSPRFIIENIISELKYNGFHNEVNRNLFRTELEYWLKQPIFKSLFGKECGSMLAIWGSKPLIATSVCHTILSKMDDGALFRAAIKNLTNVLEKNDFSFENKTKVHQYTDILIAEFLSKGYAIEDISKCIEPLDTVMAESTCIIIAPDNYWGFSRTDYSSDEEYHNVLDNHFSSMKIADKVNILQQHYDLEESDAYVLIRLNGIKGEIDSYIDDINIYSVGNKRYITDNAGDNNIETIDPNHTLINVAIPVKNKNEKRSIILAINKLESVIALLELRIDFNNEITYSDKNITVVVDGRPIYVHNSLNDKLPKFDDSDLKKQCYTEFSEYKDEVFTLSQRLATSKSISQDDFHKLRTSANWIQKAKATESSSDKLLYSWISIEGLLKLEQEYRNELAEKKDNPGTITVIRNTLLAIVKRNKFHHYIWQVFHSLNWNFKHGGNRYGISEPLKTELYQNSKENSVPKSNLFKCLDKLIGEVVEESFRTDLERFKSFYADNSSGITNFCNQISSELTYIYWFRNMIMHNATIPSYQVNYYANRALFYACSLTNAILTVSTTNQLSISDSVIKIASDGKIFDAGLQDKIRVLKNG